MKCPRCQRENPSRVKVSGVRNAACSPLQLRNHGCPPGRCASSARACAALGRRTPPRFASLETYHRIFAAKADLEGERRKVTVLIATSVWATSTPERASTRQAQESLAAATTHREMDVVSGLSRKTEQDQNGG